MTGFARNFVLENADAVVDAVKTGKISHFFLVGGCDGYKPGRSYYTEFVKRRRPTPSSSRWPVANTASTTWIWEPSPAFRASWT